jgi:hypothetical protein
VPNAVPTSTIFWVSAELIKPISAVRTKKNINTDGITIQIDGSDYLIRMRHDKLSKGWVI